MLTSTTTYISKVSDRPVTILIHLKSDDWSDIAPNAQQISINGYFSAISFLRSLLRLRRVFSGAESFSILGADVLDGNYSLTRSMRRLMMADYAIRMGVPSRVLGFSYADSAHSKAQGYLSRISPKLQLFARDRLSFERLRGISKGTTHLVADTAFLLPPADPPSAIGRAALEFIKATKGGSGRVIAFNANPLGSAMSAGAHRASESVEALDVLVAEHVRSLMTMDKHLAMVFMAHDTREPHNDQAILQKVFDRLRPSDQTRIFLAFEGLTARDVKSICAACDLSVTGRMHMGIASLGGTTPCLFLDFQGKVKGLLEHFEATNMIFDWALYCDTPSFSRLVMDNLDAAPANRAQLKANKAQVIQLSLKNFHPFEET